MDGLEDENVDKLEIW